MVADLSLPNTAPDENVFIEDAMAKYKENEREIKRERKFW
jgi:hypothetical protein